MRTVAVVPAAGASRRMGQAKLLLPYGATTVIGATLQALREGGVATLVVVTNGDSAVAAAAKAAGAEVVVNRLPEAGMLSSIQAGVAGARQLVGNADAVLLVCPADLPALRATTVATLLTAFNCSPASPRLLLPVWSGQRGHPLLIHRQLWPAIDRLDPARGLRELLAIHATEVATLAVDDDGTRRDVDTPADYEELLAASHPSPPAMA